MVVAVAATLALVALESADVDASALASVPIGSPNDFMQVNWTGPAPVGTELTQEFEVGSEAPFMNWDIGWRWSNSKTFAYMGLQTNGDRVGGGTGNTAIFTVQGATQSEGPCDDYKGDVGKSCRVAFDFDVNRVYKFDLTTIQRGSGEVWWQVAVTDELTAVTTTIAKVAVPASFGVIASMWDSTQFFNGVAQCRQVPFSSASWGRPHVGGTTIGTDQWDFAADSQPHCNSGAATSTELTNQLPGLRITVGSPPPTTGAKADISISHSDDPTHAGQITPSTRLTVTPTQRCPDGTEPALGIVSAGRDITTANGPFGQPLVTRIPGEPHQLYIGQTGTTVMQARCGQAVTASQTIDVVADAYVAMGDSLGSGEGLTDNSYLQGTFGPDSHGVSTGCHRAQLGWAHAVGSMPGRDGLPWDFVACSGGVTADIYKSKAGYYQSDGEYLPPQIYSVDPTATKLVTLSIGANDVGFQDLVTDCLAESVAPGSGSGDCHVRGTLFNGPADVSRGFASITGVPNLEHTTVIGTGSTRYKVLPQVYEDIAARLAPNGVLVVVGVPELMRSYARIPARDTLKSCNVGTKNSPVLKYKMTEPESNCWTINRCGAI